MNQQTNSFWTKEDLTQVKREDSRTITRMASCGWKQVCRGLGTFNHWRSLYPAGQGWAWGKEAAETCRCANSDHSQRQSCTTKAVSRSEVSVPRRPSRELHSFLSKFTRRGGSTPEPLTCLNAGEAGLVMEAGIVLHRSRKYLIVF
uniref:Uncharacterized protein n=1 Tax=Myotis myotis TaxID=51298 RepID=A0A7J7TJL8_MYOMY|nr:hypothetical protein mMyoMyo1_009093 [Myotis myotis]